jgi:hypothetical protein
MGSVEGKKCEKPTKQTRGERQGIDKVGTTDSFFAAEIKSVEICA